MLVNPALTSWYSLNKLNECPLRCTCKSAAGPAPYSGGKIVAALFISVGRVELSTICPSTVQWLSALHVKSAPPILFHPPPNSSSVYIIPTFDPLPRACETRPTYALARL